MFADSHYSLAWMIIFSCVAIDTAKHTQENFCSKAKNPWKLQKISLSKGLPYAYTVPVVIKTHEYNL